MNWIFFSTNALLGLGLAADAFSVSLANGLAEPRMKKARMAGMALLFGLFQGLMPLLGWFFVHNFVLYFHAVQPWIPWIALALLVFIGGKMIRDGMHPCAEDDLVCQLQKRASLGTLLLQGIATSIDALSVGFTISEYDFKKALVAVILIAAITFAVCFGGIAIGKKFGTKLSEKAAILGGVILILIGLEIFISSFF